MYYIIRPYCKVAHPAMGNNPEILIKIEFFRGLEISGKIFSRRYELSRGFEQGI